MREQPARARHGSTPAESLLPWLAEAARRATSRSPSISTRRSDDPGVGAASRGGYRLFDSLLVFQNYLVDEAALRREPMPMSDPLVATPRPRTTR